MSKQTAVQWLHYHLLHLMQTREWRSKDLHIEKFDELFIEAKAMEREQIEQAYKQGCWDEIEERMDSYSNELYKTYYNKTYKGGSNE